MGSRGIIPARAWSGRDKIIFRIVFIYCCLQAVPLDWKYYCNIAAIPWSHFSYRDLFYISRFTPQWIASSHPPLSWGINGPGDWMILLAISLAGAVAWSYLDRSRRSYNDLYYFLRAILRYRLSIAVIAYGFVKLFPMQQPYPSLSLLNTRYGEFSDWKIASLSYGVAPSFESFLGVVEILAAILLLNRKSASIGAAIVIGFTGNVFLSNLGYGGGEAVYCLYLITLAAVIVWYDLGRWINLVSLERPTRPNAYYPRFYDLGRWRTYIKAGFIIFFVGLYGGLSGYMYAHGSYQYPAMPGLADISGLYNVSEFILNGQARPYSLTDPLRWQDVVFEKWNTLSIRTLRPVEPDMLNTEEIFVNDRDRNYESSGSQGRRFYSYTADTSAQLIHLTLKGNNEKVRVCTLAYRRPVPGRLIISGTDDEGNTIRAVLNRINKIYLLDESVKIPNHRSVFE